MKNADTRERIDVSRKDLPHREDSPETVAPEPETEGDFYVRLAEHIQATIDAALGTRDRGAVVKRIREKIEAVDRG